MKKTYLVLLGLALLLTPALAKMPFAPDRTIGLHLGPKNPTFDESKFPDIDFYYTPQLRWREAKASGTPEVLVNWLNQGGVTTNQLILIDRKGTVDLTGFLGAGKKIVEVHDLGLVYTVGERLQHLVEEGRASIKQNKGPVKWDSVSDLEGRRFPSFEVWNASGEARDISEVVSENGRTEMMIVFRIPYNYRFREVEEHLEDAVDVMALLGSITQMESGEQHTGYLKKIEEELYNR